MKKAELIRVEHGKEHTIGVMLIDGVALGFTMEDEWADNKKSVSCIPTGTYTVVRHQSPKYGECFMVENVPNRSLILIHAGNTDDDTEGCILLGRNTGMMNGERAVMNSKLAVADFMALMKGENKFELTITDWRSA
ncbi:MAG: DUF5675 family protein [Deferribacterales bacterium]